jgi:NAD(P)-dependent dehydrogenase (short-subunit alcohol dehydrogenase family)
VIAIFGGGEIAEQGIVPVVGEAVIVRADYCDIRDSRDVYETMSLLRADTVIYTAGCSQVGHIGPGRAPSYEEEIAVNLVGAFHVASAGIGWGMKTFIAIASLAGLYGKPNHSGYSASKAGLISLVQSLAMEGHNAYAISPGRVNTQMRERDYPGEDPKTRLDPTVIGELVRDILDGKYTPGDNLVIRMRGHEVLPVEVHRGDGWRERLRVGEPPTC